jgi:hypothetical protein
MLPFASSKVVPINAVPSVGALQLFLCSVREVVYFLSFFVPLFALISSLVVIFSTSCFYSLLACQRIFYYPRMVYSFPLWKNLLHMPLVYIFRYI